MKRKMPPSVVILGDDWTLTAAVRGLISERWPGVETAETGSPDGLSVCLRRYPAAGVLLCLRPHESLPWLDSLCPLLWNRVVRVVSPTVWYSDRMVLGYLGYRRAISVDELGAWLGGNKEEHPLSGFMDEVMCSAESCRSAPPPPGRMSRTRTAKLVREVQKESQRMLPTQVTARQWFILCCLAKGMKGGQVAALMGLKEKTISLYRRHVLCALGMEEVKSGMPLYRSVMVRESLQRNLSCREVPESRCGTPGAGERIADCSGTVNLATTDKEGRYDRTDAG
ncbi:LuxR C-terminal-related transcriptional regulator [Salmonella enterica subsp. enterica serovar Braenderup]|uniref:LuxR C-terminal-related transcriptional regulator n=1 Tax=Salmonella enterica TaxID=28901 RepID=UPI0009AED5DA|nr:LuxR C-terminal-related transcriptional regulator [Salmonella enterica]